MGDRAPVHITIGGACPREHLETFAVHAGNYDLRIEWDGEPFDPAGLVAGEPLELYGTELNVGQIPEIDTFCVAHGLPFRRWSADASVRSSPRSSCSTAADPCAITRRARTNGSSFPRWGSKASPGCATSSARWRGLN